MIVGESQRRNFHGANLFTGFGTHIEPFGDLRDVRWFSGSSGGLINFRTLNLESEFWSRRSLGSFFGQNSFVFSAASRGFALLALSLFRADLRFDFRSYARFKLGSLSNFCLGT